MLKKCSKCKLEKPVEDFAKSKDKKDGRNYNCKECQKKVLQKSLQK